MHKLPVTMPDYKIKKSDKAPFTVKWEESMGWFIIPRIGEKCTWGIYNNPEKKLTNVSVTEVVGLAVVHGVEGVEFISREYENSPNEEPLPDDTLTRTFVEQLTNTHSRCLATCTYDGKTRRISTFLDDDFLNNWGYGEDNCGKEIHLKPKGIITRVGNEIHTNGNPLQLDVVGRYDIAIGGTNYDCICILDVYQNDGVLVEQFIDEHGRTVLWRRFNRDDWNQKTYKQPWSEKLPKSERFTVNGNLYVHWYDCITDYIL